MPTLCPVGRIAELLAQISVLHSHLIAIEFSRPVSIVVDPNAIGWNDSQHSITGMLEI